MASSSPKKAAPKFRRISSSNMLNQQNGKDSFCCSASIPESTTTMQDYFGQQSSFAETPAHNLDTTDMQ